MSKISKNADLLKLLIKETISLVEQEAEIDDIFGQYLFAPQRKDLPPMASREENTDEEDELLADLSAHYYGEINLLNPWINKLDQLNKQGKYSQVLQVPQTYKYAYRVLSAYRKTLEDMLGRKLTEKELDPKAAIKGFEASKALYKEDYGDKMHSSWTVDANIFNEIYEDWGNIGEALTYMVYLRAPIASNNFILNPDVLTKTKIPGHYAYQKEIINVGNVTCDKIIWVANPPGIKYSDERKPSYANYRKKAVEYGANQIKKEK